MSKRKTKPKGMKDADRNAQRPVSVPAVVAEEQGNAADAAAAHAGAAGTASGTPQPAAEPVDGVDERSGAGPVDAPEEAADQVAASGKLVDPPLGDQAGLVAAGGEAAAAAGGVGDAAEALGQGEEVIDSSDPVDVLLFVHRTTPQALVAAAYFAMDEALRLACLIHGVEEPERVDFCGLFEHQAMADEAHELISNHGNLPADSLWLHLTARGLMPKTAEAFADLPGWQRHGFTLFIATYEALLPVINGMIAERREALRAQAQAEAPARRVPLSDTIFERHAHVGELMDGLRLTPRR